VALLAWLLDQPAASHLGTLLEHAALGELDLLMSWINSGEVYYIVARRHGAEKAEEFLRRLPSLPIDLVLPDTIDVIAAADLKSKRRLSYADAFAAALAIRDRSHTRHGRPGAPSLIGRTDG
jgi:ribonuclease VapC